jgi:serine protease
MAAGQEQAAMNLKRQTSGVMTWLAWMVAGLVSLMGAAGSAHSAEPMAQGLIVKMKDAQPAPVVRLRALVKPMGTPSQLRTRLHAAAQRSRVSFVLQRDTAFGAMVVSKASLMSMADAQAEAARLRKDPDVEWVVVNELLQPAAYAFDDPRRAQQRWMDDSNSGAFPNIPAAFARMEGQTLSPVVVAVLDTGILPHPDFEGRVYRRGSANPGGYDFVSEYLLSNDGDGLDDDGTDTGDYLTDAQLRSNASAFSRLCAPDVPAAHDSTWHGTTTAGILASAGNNQIGFTGMLAPLGGVPVLPVRVSGVCGAALSDIIEGMFWAAGVNYFGSPPTNPHPARVISLSFGSSSVGCACAREGDFNGSDNVACMYRSAIKALLAKGALLVASAGNDSQADASMPASCPGVLAVTALRRDNAYKASYANATPADNSVSTVEATRFALATMGGDDLFGEDDSILTTWNTGVTTATSYAVPRTRDYAEGQGTSMATPIAAGAAALMWAVNPQLSVADILTGLTRQGVRAHAAVALNDPQRCSSVNPGRCRCTTSTCGSGVLDVYKAVDWAATATPTSYTLSANADFFTPSRGVAGAGSQQKPSGGGGGLDLTWVMALGVLTTTSLMRSRRAGHKPLAGGQGQGVQLLLQRH